MTTNADFVSPNWVGFNELDDNSFDPGTGRVGVRQFANAIQVWSWLQAEMPTVLDTARAFRAPIDAVIEAVNAHPWMFVDSRSARPWVMTGSERVAFEDVLIVAATDEAILICTDDGDKVWLPLSHATPADGWEVDERTSVLVAEWLALERGLI